MEKRKRDPGQWFIRILSTGLNPSTYFEILNRTEVNLMNFARVEDPENFVDVCD